MILGAVLRVVVAFGKLRAQAVARVSLRLRLKVRAVVAHRERPTLTITVERGHSVLVLQVKVALRKRQTYRVRGFCRFGRTVVRACVTSRYELALAI